MDATQNARSFSKDSLLRRYVLDSLAVGRSVSVETCDRKLAAGLFAIGTRMGAKTSIRNSTGPSKFWIIELKPDVGATQFDLHTMN